MLNVYVLSVNSFDWDAFDEITVVAKDEDEALEIARERVWGFDEEHGLEIRRIDLTIPQSLTASYNAG